MEVRESAARQQGEQVLRPGRARGGVKGMSKGRVGSSGWGVVPERLSSEMGNHLRDSGSGVSDVIQLPFVKHHSAVLTWVHRGG